MLNIPAIPMQFKFDWKAWLARTLSIRGMEFHIAGRALRLEGNQHLKLHDAAGTVVQMVCGAAWITQEGDIKDSFVASGEVFCIGRTGETLIAPLGSARLRLLPPQAEADAKLKLMPSGLRGSW
jgi:hypothetical protein